jgi:hypothetical protein
MKDDLLSYGADCARLWIRMALAASDGDWAGAAEAESELAKLGWKRIRRSRKRAKKRGETHQGLSPA